MGFEARSLRRIVLVLHRVYVPVTPISLTRDNLVWEIWGTGARPTLLQETILESLHDRLIMRSSDGATYHQDFCARTQMQFSVHTLVFIWLQRSTEDLYIRTLFDMLITTASISPQSSTLSSGDFRCCPS